MSAVVDTHGQAHEHDHHDHHGGYSGVMRWITTTNHKDIGTMYLWFSFIMFLVGGTMAMVIRAELFEPGLQIVNPELFNQLTTMHGLIMIFGAIMPAFVGFANWLIPMQIGAPDMAFARMNNWSFWILPFAASLLILSFFMPGGAPEESALRYVRLAAHRNTSVKVCKQTAGGSVGMRAGRGTHQAAGPCGVEVTPASTALHSRTKRSMEKRLSAVSRAAAPQRSARSRSWISASIASASALRLVSA